MRPAHRRGDRRDAGARAGAPGDRGRRDRLAEPKRLVRAADGDARELQWVAGYIAVAAATISDLDLGPAGPPTAAALDRLWAALRDEGLVDPNEVINCVGLAFGQLLVDRFGLGWVALTDEHGTEVAVRGPSDFIVFPANFVAERYESRETGFLEPFEAEVARKLRKLA